METLVQFLLSFQGPIPYLLVFGILLACGLGLPIPEDVTLFAGGLISYYGVTNVYTMIVVSFLGVMVGDSLIFFLGAKYGRHLTQKKFFKKLLPEERLNYVQAKLQKGGDRWLFAARFMPGLRAPIFFTAGTLHVPYYRFFLYDGSAALFSVPAIVGAVFYFGDQLDQVVSVIQSVEHAILAVIVLAVALIGAKWYLTHRKIRRQTLLAEGIIPAQKD